ncbi:SpvB/TcaC N-terminal domain-containing protein [Phytohabitans sp. LJ34]|uniref:SpvB/TcaC N-terminal domain-containing protein n=1 Tax=Phytohabitans sp. LJ34 TaxID=3452217 RepID=UPI003F88AFA1
MAGTDLTQSAGGSVIALPSGGGAIQGLGEKFSPDLFTGTGNYTVPIPLPAGRLGLEPKLTLGYSTGNGNGPFGLGWRLDTPGVTRKTTRGTPRYTGDDVFVLSGAEDLVPVAEVEPGRTRYRPRTEGLFARVDHVRDGTGDFWEVHAKDGTRNRYGATVADPDDPGRVFAWRITETRDPLGNLVRYEYLTDEGEGGGHRWRQPMLARISYADYGDRADPEFLVVVDFDYETRPDAFSDHRAGFEIRTSLRCAAIRVRTRAADGVDRPSRMYRFGYQPAAFNGVSLLTRIEAIGVDGATAEPTPPLTFGYSGFDPRGRRFEPVRGRALPTVALSDPTLALVDLRGAGLPDLVELGATARYWRNVGAGRFDVPRNLNEAPPFTLADRGVRFMDADGDGRPDLFVRSGPTAGYFPMSFAGGWSRRSFQPYRRMPSVDLADARVKLVDLDGDGLTDVLRSGTGGRLECWFNDADPRRAWQRTAVSNGSGPPADLGDPRVRLADMTGDRLPDIVLLRAGDITYWPNLGHGRWGRPVRMRHSPRLPDRFDPRRVLLGDIDGDGAADLVYVDNGRIQIWGNRSGDAWAEQPLTIAGTPALTDTDTVQLTDLYGTGMAGLLFGRSHAGGDPARLRFLDLTGGAKPYLLELVDNNVGATTRVHYRPSTEDFLRDDASPATRWRTTLPFPVQVVAGVVVHDAISGGRQSTEYRYHHGYWDGVEREFHGFAMVEQLDTESFDAAAGVPAEHYSPPTLTKSWFHPGPVAAAEAGDWTELDLRHEYWAGDPGLLARPPEQDAFLRHLPRADRRDAIRALRGQVLRTELYGLDGTERQQLPYTVTETVSGVRQEAPRIWFPFTLAQRTTQWERGDEPMTQFSFPGGYDAYGFATEQLAIAVPRTPGTPYLATYTTTGYARRDDAERYIVDRVADVRTYEVVNDGAMSVAGLRQAVADRVGVTLRVIGHTRTCYDGDAFTGLPAGVLGAHGLAVREESLAFTDAHFANPADRPAYLDPTGGAAWPGEYPADFRAGLPPLAGYVHRDGGYYVVTARRRYDVHDPGRVPRGLPLASLDPLGARGTIEYDAHDLLPVRATDPAGLTTTAEYDYRLLQPRTVTDANGNPSSAGYSPSGLVTARWRRGKAGEGDQTAASTRIDHDLLAFVERGQPTSVRITRRQHHDTDAAASDATLVTVEYADGFGRVTQTRSQAEDVLFGDPAFGGGVLAPDQSAKTTDAVGRRRGPSDPDNVLVSGWQRHDNKGRVVVKYEPYFDTGYDYAEPADAQRGLHTTTFFDPRGQVVRTVDPDGSEQRMVYGVPTDLTDPDSFRPTPWETYTYGANDNAGRTHGKAAQAYRDHWDTPASVERDALGRTVTTVVRNDREEAMFVTRQRYDIQGNLVGVVDALGRDAYRYRYDLAKRRWRVETIDAGRRDTVHDAAGNPVEVRDAKGALTLGGFDTLGRPTRVWARDGAAAPVTLRQRVEYGDAGTPEQPGPERDAARAANLLGRPVRHFDEAGLVTTAAVDFKGNVTSSTRRVIADGPLLDAFADGVAFQVDWTPAPGQSQAARDAELLEDLGYTTTTGFDALDRVTRHLLPSDVEGRRRELVPTYNRAGALESVRLDGTVHVRRIAYDAKGQRTLVAYGNGVMTRHAYDPLTVRAVRQRSERYTLVDELTFRPAGEVLQDYGYDHDLFGNILAIRDRTPGSGIPGNPAALNITDKTLRAMVGAGDALDRRFTYDPANRLVSATGREYEAPAGPDPWTGEPRGTDPTRTQAYTEAYQYDAVGNLQVLRHTGTGGFTRQYDVVAGTNRLRRMTVAGTGYDYTTDANGNVTGETGSRHFEWNHADQLRAFAVRAGGAEPSVHAQYLYDATGRRVKKLVRRQGGAVGVTHYVDDLFEHHRWTGPTAGANNLLHVMDDTRRIALVRVGPAGPDDGGPAVEIHLPDHRGSSAVVVDGTGAFVSREEHTPYGETSFGGYARKRYRFAGRQREAESGLDHFPRRYLAPWLGRWMSCDPVAGMDGAQSYAYCGGDPLNRIDRDGREWCWNVFADDCELDTELIVKTGAVALSAAEVAIGCPLAETGIGAVVCINGLDDLSSAIFDRPTLKQQAISGGLQAAGVDPETADTVGRYGSMTLSAATGAAGSAQALKTVRPTGGGHVPPPPPPSAPVRTTPRPTVPPPPVAPAVRRAVPAPQALELDNSVLSALGKSADANHQAAKTFVALANGRPLTISRATYKEALGAASKHQVKEVLRKYNIAFDATLSLERIGAFAQRLRAGVTRAGRSLSDTDAMQMAAAHLQNRIWITADRDAFRRAVDLGIQARYVGSPDQMATASRYVRQPITY